LATAWPTPVIVTMSEFGRAAAENGNGRHRSRPRQRDDGHRRKRPRRRHGTWPGLDDARRFEGRDLAVTTDFRDVFSGNRVGAHGRARDAVSRIFPGYHPATVARCDRATLVTASPT
jgi:uncharacterized protein (DUF1501 family)